MNLKNLIKDFKDLNNRFGDVARDVLADKTFPTNIKSINDLPASFINNDACMNVFYYFALEENLISIDFDGNIIWNNN